MLQAFCSGRRNTQRENIDLTSFPVSYNASKCMGLHQDYTAYSAYLYPPVLWGLLESSQFIPHRMQAQSVLSWFRSNQCLNQWFAWTYWGEAQTFQVCASNTMVLPTNLWWKNLGSSVFFPLPWIYHSLSGFLWKKENTYNCIQFRRCVWVLIISYMSKHTFEASQSHIYISVLLKGNSKSLNIVLPQCVSYIHFFPDLNSGLSIKKQCWHSFEILIFFWNKGLF